MLAAIAGYQGFVGEAAGGGIERLVRLVLFGGVYVILSVPVAAVLATLIDVFVRDRDPSKEDVPAVIFPAQEREAS